MPHLDQQVRSSQVAMDLGSAHPSDSSTWHSDVPHESPLPGSHAQGNNKAPLKVAGKISMQDVPKVGIRLTKKSLALDQLKAGGKTMREIAKDTSLLLGSVAV